MATPSEIRIHNWNVAREVSKACQERLRDAGILDPIQRMVFMQDCIEQGNRLARSEGRFLQEDY